MNKPYQMKHSAKRCSFLLTLSAALLAAPTHLIGQTSANADEELETIDLGTATSSAIPLALDESFAPEVSFSGTDLRLSGGNTPIEGLRQLPSFVGGTATEQDSNGGTGAAAINLRGLGSSSTLTLINGRRGGVFEDVNLVPVSAISSVNIVKDGASTTFGADAVAGVVDFNLFLTPPPENTASITYGVTSESDGQVMSGSILGGFTAKEDRLRVVIGLEWYERDTIFARDRDVSADPDLREFQGFNGGSPTFAGRGEAGAAIDAINPATNEPFFGPQGQDNPDPDRIILRDGVEAATSLADFRRFNNDDWFNFRVFTPAIPGQERYSAWGSIEYDVADNITAFANILYSNLETDNGIAPSPFGVFGLENSPYSAQLEAPVSFMRYRSVEIGNRSFFFDKDAVYVVAGLKGSFMEERFNWEVAISQNEATQIETNSGFPNGDLLDAEVAAGNFNPYAREFSTGSAVINGETFEWDNAAALRRAAVQDSIKEFERYRQIDAKINGELFDMPGGAFLGAVGVEYREELLDVRPGQLYSAGTALGLNTENAFKATSEIYGAFAEVLVPIFGAEQDIPALHALELNLAVRTEDFSPAGTVDGVVFEPSYDSTDYKIGLRWLPYEDLIVRATFSTAFRAPALDELYQAPGGSFPQLQDPFAPQNSNQTEITVGGNPELRPEESENFTIGAVWTPEVIPGLYVSVDYYHIERENIVVFDTAQFILDTNFAGQGAGFPMDNGDGTFTFDPNAVFADNISRQPDGTLVESGPAVDARALNIASSETSGIDFVIGYTLETEDIGTFTAEVQANRFLTWEYQPAPGQPTVEALGNFVDQSTSELSPGSIPEWKGFFSLTWEMDNILVSTTINYIDEINDDPGSLFDPDDLTGIGGEDGPIEPTRTIDSWTTWDIVAQYTFTDIPIGYINDLSLRLGIENITDEPPPVAVGASNDNYDTSLHSLRGRFFYLTVTRDF